MRTITTDLFSFDELDENAQQRAIEDARHRGWYGDAWDEEWQDSLDKAQHALGFRVVDWQVGSDCASARVSIGDDVGDLQGVRAWKYIEANWKSIIGDDGSCPFTGYCGDESFLDPIRAFLRAPKPDVTIAQLIDRAAQSWAKAWREDKLSQLTDEYIADDHRANEREFTKDGRLYS